MTLQTDYGQATFHFSVAGGAKPYTCTMGFGAGTSHPADPQAVADAWYTACTEDSGDPFWPSNFFVGWTFSGVTTLYKSSSGLTTGSHIEPVAGTAVTGSPAVPLVDPYNPVVISKRTAFAGRDERGRMYCPPVWLHMALVDPNGVIDPTRLALIQGYWDDFLGDVADEIESQAVLNHLAVGETNVGQPVTGLIVRNVVGSQRRRKARAS